MDVRNLLLAGLLVFGAGSIGYSQVYADGTTMNELMRNGLLALLGGGGLVYNNFSSLGSLVSKKQVTQDSPTYYLPEAKENEDFKCIAYLRNRFSKAGDKDGMEACSVLMNMLFKLHSKK